MDKNKKGSKTILIVDDEAEIVKIVQMRLERNGYTVIPAANGRDAVKLAAQKKPDLIILDKGMPGLDGAQTLNAIRKDAGTAGIPAIFFTCAVYEGFEAECYQAGAQGVIYKPMVRELLDLINRIFSGEKIAPKAK